MKLNIGIRLNAWAGATVTDRARDLLKYGHPYPSDKSALKLLARRSKAAKFIKYLRSMVSVTQTDQ